MRTIKRFFSNFHRYVLVLLLSVLFWAFIMFIATDTTRAKKVMVYIDAKSVRSIEMAAALEEFKPEGIKLISVHPFSYAAFNTLAPGGADIYIMNETAVKENAGVLCPIESGFDEFAESGFRIDGRLYGLPIRTEEGSSAAGYIGYDGDENWYLCFNLGSVHICDWTGTGDSAAIETAKRILALP